VRPQPASSAPRNRNHEVVLAPPVVDAEVLEPPIEERSVRAVVELAAREPVAARERVPSQYAYCDDWKVTIRVHVEPSGVTSTRPGMCECPVTVHVYGDVVTQSRTAFQMHCGSPSWFCVQYLRLHLLPRTGRERPELPKRR
jgi:hypothetical protein